MFLLLGIDSVPAYAVIVNSSNTYISIVNTHTTYKIQYKNIIYIHGIVIFNEL